MPSNREILYTIRMRNQASAAVKQLSADLAAQGTSLKQVAQQLQQVQVQAARVGTATAAAAKGTAALAASAKDISTAAKGIQTFTKAMSDAASKSTGFGAITQAVDNLDRVFRTSQGISVYRARLQGLVSTLAALPGQLQAVQAAALSLAGVAPPRPPRTTAGGGAAPPSTPPPSNPTPAAGGGSGGGNTNSQQSFNGALGQTKSRLAEIRDQLTLLAGLTATAFGARKVLEMADAYTRVISQLKLITDGNRNLRDTYDALFDVANRNRTSIESTAEIYAKFNNATRTLGVTQQSVVDVTDSVSKAVAIFGGNAQSAQAALFQFSQGLASGTLRGEELNSVMEQAPRLAQAIADGLKNSAGTIGIPLGALRSYAEQGKLTTEAIFNALQNQRSKLEAEYAQTGVTLGQAFIVAKNFAIDFVGKADEATGASRKIGTAIVDAMKGLQNPAAVSAIQSAMTGFASAVTGAISVMRFLVDHVQLTVTAFVALKALSLAPFFAAMGASAGAAVSQLLVFNVATRTVAIGASAANIAVNGLNAAMSRMGGPIGVAITVAATALAFWLTTTKSSVEAGGQLAEVTEKLKANYDGATNAVKNLTEAEVAREQLKAQSARKAFADETAAQAKALNRALAPSLFEGTDGSRLAQRFFPFREEVEAFRKSVQNGKADFDQLQKAVALRAQSNPALRDVASELNEAAEAGRKAQGSLAQADATLKVLDGTATKAQATIAGVATTLDVAAKADPFKALQQAFENLKTGIEAQVPVLKAFNDNKAAVMAVDEKYTAVLRDLNVALKGNALSQAEFNEKVADAEGKLGRAKDAINGVFQATRELRDAQRDLGVNDLLDRSRVLEEINIKYDRTIRGLKETVTDQTKLKSLVEEQNTLRAKEVSQVDTKFQNNDMRDRILGLQNEARLLGLSGEARERAAALLDVEAAARKAGVSNIDAQVAAYAKEYDALQKAKDARQTMGDGFNTAVTKYLEDAKRVGDQSAQMFGQVFDHLGDGFVDVFKNGKDGFKSMLDNIANDLLKFASRQLFRTLLSSVFGDGQGGTGSNTGVMGGIGASIMSAFGVKQAQTTAASAGAVASIAGGSIGSGVTSALSTAAGSAATGVTALSDAATRATGSFGDIPSQLSSMLKGLGATDAGVAGFLGNVQRESNFRPDVVNPSSGAYGLIQALGSRKTALFDQYGSNPTAEQQVAFIKNELQTTEKASLKMLQNAGTLEDGVKAGVRFERPEGYAEAVKAGDLSQVPDFGTRLGFGKKFGETGSSDPWSLNGSTLSDETVTKLNGQFDEISTKTAGLDTSFSQMGTALDKANPQILNGVDGVTGSLTQGGSQMGKAFSDVSGTIGTAGDSLGNTITSLASKLASAGGNFSSLFGVGSVTNVGSGFAGDGLDLGSGSASSWFHAGGIVGRNSRQTGTADSSLWSGAPRFHTGGIVGGLKSRERAIIAKDDEAVFPTVRMGNGEFGIRATGFTGGGAGGGGGGNVSFGDINIQTSGSSGDSQKDAEHSKMMAREMKESLRALVREELINNSRSGGMFTKGITR